MKDMDSTRYRAAVLWRAVLLCVGFWGLLDGAGITKGRYNPNFPHMFTNVSNLFAWGYFALALVSLIRNRPGAVRSGRRSIGRNSSGCYLPGQNSPGRGSTGRNSPGRNITGRDSSVRNSPGRNSPGRRICESEKGVFAPVAKYTALVSLLVTMIIGHVMLFDALVQDGRIVWHLIVLHYAVPIMSLLDWLFFDPKGRMPARGPLAWLSLVLVYLGFTMVSVGVFGIYMGGGTTAEQSNYPYTFLDPGIVGAAGVIKFCAAMLVLFIFLGYVFYGIDHRLGRR